MQGDFSRFTFRKRKHYRLVLRQQGRVDVDADWNEQQQIHRHIGETEAADVIGPSGYPKSLPNAFAIQADPAASSGLTVAPGRIYVDGLLCENDADVPVDLFAQPDLAAEGGALDGITLPPPDAATFAAYLEVRLRHVSARQDPEIREKALGGPDTATRGQVVWQVKLQAIGSAACSAFTPPPSPDGTLRASTVAPPAATPCTIPPTAGYRRLENQHYRVEVHLGSDTGTPTFKWSRENASIVTSVTSLGGQTIGVTDLGRDDVTLGFKGAEWVELIDDHAELGVGHGTLLRVDRAEGTSIVVRPETPVPTLALAPGETLATRNVRLIRWEQTGALADGVPIGAGPIALEGGLQVEFQGTTYRSGDFWLIPARTAIDGETGNIEWPSGTFLPPHGVERHYAPLAVVSYAGAGAAPTVPLDCRKPFPPLTAITASDVTVRADTCGLPGVSTVQDQIDALCQARDGCCALALRPEMDWQTVLRNLPGPVASVCFAAGDYTLDAPIVFERFRSLKIAGAGPGTSLRAPGSQAVFVFRDCQAVEVADLAAEAGKAGGIKGPDKLKGAGVLGFQRCRSVKVEGTTLLGAEDLTNSGTTVRTASCIKVVGDPGAVADPLQPPTSARILRNDLTVGRFQEGIVVADMARVQVEDNILTARPTTTRPRLDTLLNANKTLRTNLRRSLLTETTLLSVTGAPLTPPAQPTPPPPPAPAPPAGGAGIGRLSAGLRVGSLLGHPATDVKLNVGGSPLKIRTPTALAGVWASLLEQPKLAAKPGETVGRRVVRAADALLRNPRIRNQFPPAASWWAGLNRWWLSNPVPAAQGIVVGGRMASEVRIVNNTVTGMAQGIHVGLSHAGAGQGVPKRNVRGAGTDVATSVLITGNTLTVLGTAVLREQAGIFVGNCDTLVVRENRLTATVPFTQDAFPGEGIRVFGWIGPLAVIERNRLSGFPAAVDFHPLGTPPAGRAWINADNPHP